MGTYTDLKVWNVALNTFTTLPATSLKVRSVDAQAAIRRVINQNGINLQLKTFTGKLTNDSGTLKIRDESTNILHTLQWGQYKSAFQITDQYNLQIQDKTFNKNDIFEGLTNYLNRRIKVEGHLINNTIHIHKVTAVNQVTPTNLQAKNITLSSFKVDWVPGVDESKYNLKHYVLNINNQDVGSFSSAACTTIQYFPNAPFILSPNTDYIVKVSAAYDLGSGVFFYSDYSDPITVRTLSPTPTPTPSSTSNCTKDVIVTNTTWKWQDGVNIGNTVVVPNPIFAPNIPGASAIWTSDGACYECGHIFFQNYTLPAGWYVQNAKLWAKATQYADIAVRGYGVGNVTANDSSAYTDGKFFQIDPSFFGQGGNSLKVTFFAQNFNLPRPSIMGRFEIDRCEL